MMVNKNKETRDNIPFATRSEVVLVVVFGCLCLALFAVLTGLAGLPVAVAAVLVTFVYLVSVALLGLHRQRTQTVLPVRNIREFLGESGSTVFHNMTSPVLCLNNDSRVLWYNDAMASVLPTGENLIGKTASQIFGAAVSMDDAEAAPCELYGHTFLMEGFSISHEEEGLYLLLLRDVTEQRALEKKYTDERLAVAYIAIDNIEDILQYVHEKFRDAVSSVDDILKAWAEEMDGVIKSYDSDKYIMFFDSARLDQCLESRFSILDRIRDTRVGDGVSVTVSIGVSRIAGSIHEREMAAREAIDMALQRGGDQAVYKTEDSTEYYGGHTKSVYKRSSVRARMFSARLAAMMARADNVLVMGHRYGDFDSIGASVGVARLAMLSSTRVNIAVDPRDRNLEPCLRMLQETEIYSQMFVDNAEGMDLIGPDTLLVLVDHNALARSQFSDISQKVGNVVVIDHHRQLVETPDTVKLTYIEPSASSTCEIVTDMLENSITSQNLLKEEANILLAGILVDTKQFTRNTGTRTFGAAQYLRGAGADPMDVYALFKTDPADLSKEARFHTDITIYRGNIAISCCDGDTDESYRVIASKAADKMLTLKGIEASFTLVHIGDQIHISGRSTGKINVQLILEKLNGGGHFDAAGAQVISNSVTSVLTKLKASIDDYFD